MENLYRFDDREVQPGERTTIDLPVAKLYTHTRMTLPIHVVRGREEGARLFVCATIHGDELNGVEIIRRLLRRRELSHLRGMLVAAPVVNLYGFLHGARYLPDRRDLNRSFPGSERGSLASRLAHLFMEQIVAKCTHGIDLHTGSSNRSNLPQIRATLKNRENRRLAERFGTPVVLDTTSRDGSLRASVDDRGIPMLLYEAGESLRLDEVAIRAGLNGILNVMRTIGMLPGQPVKQRVRPAIAMDSRWVRAPSSGMLETRLKLGARVTKGTRMGWIVDPFGEDDVSVVAPVSGIVIGRQYNPLVHGGDALFHVATFGSAEQVEESLEAFQDEYDPYDE